MELEKVLKERFSVRKYKEDKVEQEQLDKILEAGRIAPTAKNNQPQRIYVLKSQEALEKLDSVCRMRFGAPIVLMVCCDMNEVHYLPYEEGYNTSEMDCSIVCTQMMLEAYNIGVDSLWIRAFNSRVLKETYNLPENIKPICLLALGYKTEDCKPNEILHFTKNKIEDEVKYL